jgi:hypothetical protein
MNDQHIGEESVYPALANDEVVYRLARKRSWIDEDTGKLLPDAFYLGPNGSDLSVLLASTCSLELAKTGAGHLNKVYGVHSLVVSRIRSLGLDVVRDTDIHANIRGLPHKEDDLETATVLADLLAEQAEELWRRP